MSAEAQAPPRRNPTTLAFMALLAGAVAIAAAPILVRLSDVSPAASAFWRMGLAAPVLWLWLLRSAPRPGVTPVDSRHGLRMAVLGGIFFGVDMACYHLALTWTSVANTTLEANLAPIWVTLGAWLLWRHRPAHLFLLALALTLVGALLLIGPNLKTGGNTFNGDMVGVMAGLFYAAYMLAIKSANGALSIARLMTISTAVSAAILLPYALLSSEQMLPAGTQGWLVLVALALLPQVAGQSLIAWGFTHLPAGISAVTLLLQPVLAALFGWLLLNEGMTPMQMAGGAVVLTGIYLARRSG